MHRRLQESSTCPQHWRLKPNSQKKRLLALCEKLRGVHQNPRWKYASNANLGLALMGPCVSLSGSIPFSLVKAQRYSCYGRRNKQVCSQCCKPRACGCIYRQLCKIKRWIQFGWNTSNIRTCPNPCLPKTCKFLDFWTGAIQVPWHSSTRHTSTWRHNSENPACNVIYM